MGQHAQDFEERRLLQIALNLFQQMAEIQQLRAAVRSAEASKARKLLTRSDGVGQDDVGGQCQDSAG